MAAHLGTSGSQKAKSDKEDTRTQEGPENGEMAQQAINFRHLVFCLL